MASSKAVPVEGVEQGAEIPVAVMRGACEANCKGVGRNMWAMMVNWGVYINSKLAMATCTF